MRREFVKMMYCEELFYSQMSKVAAVIATAMSTYVVCRIVEVIASV